MTNGWDVWGGDKDTESRELDYLTREWWKRTFIIHHDSLQTGQATSGGVGPNVPS